MTPEKVNYDVLSFEARRKPIKLFEWQKGADILLQNIEDEINKHGGYYIFRDNVIIECSKYIDGNSRKAAKQRIRYNSGKNPSLYSITKSHIRVKSNRPYLK